MAAAVRPYLEWDDSDDEVLVRGVLSGDHELFGIIVQRYSQRLYRVALSVVRDFADAEDVVQDTFTSALQHLSQYSGRGKLINWLARIARNNSLACIASRRRELRIVDDEEQSFALRFADSKLDPEQHAAAVQTSQLVRQAVRALPNHHRDVVALRDLDDLDTRTAAMCLGISEQNLKVRLHRGRRSLRGILVNGVRSYALRPSLVAKGE